MFNRHQLYRSRTHRESWTLAPPHSSPLGRSGWVPARDSPGISTAVSPRSLPRTAWLRGAAKGASSTLSQLSPTSSSPLNTHFRAPRRPFSCSGSLLKPGPAPPGARAPLLFP